MAERVGKNVHGTLALLSALSRAVRWHVLRATTAASSGHPTSSLSAVELGVALFFGGVFRSNLRRPKELTNDRFILSKGHAAPLLYALYAAAGKVPLRELLKLRQLGSRLEGHPSVRFPYTDFPTGSLGQGLSVGCGMALTAKLQHLPYQTFVLLGDGEMAEGSVWEAMQFAAHRNLDNLTAIVDVNRLGQSGPTMLGWNMRAYAAQARAHGWQAIVLDGHDLPAILRAYRTALATKGKPTVLFARTLKGKGVPAYENREYVHGKPLTRVECREALRALGPMDYRLRGIIATPKPAKPVQITTKRALPPAHYKAKTPMTSREGFGNALLRFAPAYPQMVVLDADVANSTSADRFAKRHPRRFIQTYIAEQNMVGLASGLAARGMLPVASTFAAFFTRAFDQLRMLQYAKLHAVFVGSHAGVHIGKDGPSQMGLEDIALFRALERCAVLYPSDAPSAETLLGEALKTKELAYLRLTRKLLPVIYRAGTRFPIGGSKTIRRSPKDRATVIAAGVTLHEALKAADILVRRGIRIRVIDLYSIEPIDAATLKKAARETKQLIVVEDHRPEGGIGEAVRSALGPLAGTVVSLAVRKTPRSGKAEELLAYGGIDAGMIVKKIVQSVK